MLCLLSTELVPKPMSSFLSIIAQMVTSSMPVNVNNVQQGTECNPKKSALSARGTGQTTPQITKGLCFEKEV